MCPKLDRLTTDKCKDNTGCRSETTLLCVKVRGALFSGPVLLPLQTAFRHYTQSWQKPLRNSTNLWWASWNVFIDHMVLDISCICKELLRNIMEHRLKPARGDLSHKLHSLRWAESISSFKHIWLNINWKYWKWNWKLEKHLSVVRHSSIVCESDNKTESDCTKEKDGNGKRSPGNARDEWLC